MDRAELAEAFRKSWEKFNAAAPKGCGCSKTQFVDTVFRAPEVFAPELLAQAQAWDARNDRPRYPRRSR